ncbi:MAG: hypothetical protein WD064_03010 [Acidimicrobiia bacterium]
MAKETGLGWTTLDIDDEAGAAQDLRADVQSMAFATPRGVQDVTGIDKSAMERLLLLSDMSITLNFVFDDATSDSVHDVFKTVPSSNNPKRTTLLVVSGQTLTAEILYTDYAYSRNADGSLTGTVPGVLADGVAAAWT